MTARSIVQIFDNYQKARIQFVQSVAETASKPQNIEILSSANVLDLLKPLLTDICPQIRQCAAIAIGRLVDQDAKMAKTVLNDDFLPLLLSFFDEQSKFYKKSVLFVIRAICKHNAALATGIVQAGGLSALLYCIGDFEPMVKESALWGLGYMARHNATLAQIVVDSGALNHIVLCLQEPEISLKQVAANVLADISKHNVDLAQGIVDAGAVSYLAKSLNNQDEKLKRIVLTSLSNIAKHSIDLAEVVVEANTFPNVLIHMAHACPKVRKQAACLVRDIVKHSLELTQMVVNLGGIGSLLETIANDKLSEIKVPCITAIGYMGGHSDQISLSVLSCNGLMQLAEIINEAQDETVQAVAVWAVGQIGKHSPEHSNAVAATNIFPKLLQLYQSPVSSQDLHDKAKNTLKQCLQKCMMLSALDPLIYDAPGDILKYVLGQFTKVLPNDPKARRLFVTTGALRKMQEIDAEPGSTLMEYITVINSCFPEEIVRYYSPGYSETLLEKVELYSPEVMTLLRETRLTNSEVQTDCGIVLDKSTSPTTSQDLTAIAAGR